MEGKRIEVINPYNDEQVESINDFCLHHDLENVAKDLLSKKNSKETEFSFLNPILEGYLALFGRDNKVKDFCKFHAEKDIKQCFLAFPNVNLKKRELVDLALLYSFNELGMETTIISSAKEDHSLRTSLEQHGFSLVSDDEDGIAFVVSKDEIEFSKKGVRTL